MKVLNMSTAPTSVSTLSVKRTNNLQISKTPNKVASYYNSKNQNLASQINIMARKPISLSKTLTPLKFSKLFYKALQKALMDISV